MRRCRARECPINGVTGHDRLVVAARNDTAFERLARNHTTQPVTYTQNPPIGGPHSPQWLTCGVYTTPVPNENAVHDLEHGAVWITYQPSLPAAQVAIIQADALAPPVVHGTRSSRSPPTPACQAPSSHQRGVFNSN